MNRRPCPLGRACPAELASLSGVRGVLEQPSGRDEAVDLLAKSDRDHRKDDQYDEQDEEELEHRLFAGRCCDLLVQLRDRVVSWINRLDLVHDLLSIGNAAKFDVALSEELHSPGVFWIRRDDPF